MLNSFLCHNFYGDDMKNIKRVFKINVVVSKEDFNKEIDEIVKHCKKVDKSIFFVDLVRNKNNR